MTKYPEKERMKKKRKEKNKKQDLSGGKIYFADTISEVSVPCELALLHWA